MPMSLTDRLDEWLGLLQKHRAIAIVRCADFDSAYQMALAAAAGGMRLIEITWNSDRPERLIERLRRELPQCTIGTGTILNRQQLESAIDAGAQFAFSPHFDPDLLAACLHKHRVPFVPGVFSPTEITQAYRAGAKVVKVFPIESLGGAEYIKCLQSPLSHIPLIPTGGITFENASQMIEAGAIAVGISSSLFPSVDIAKKDWQKIASRTRILLESLAKPNLSQTDIPDKVALLSEPKEQ